MQPTKLDDLMVFWAVAQTGSFAKAAHQLGTTQPTVSRRIKALEDVLGTSLFDRRQSGTALTNEAQLILPHLEAIQSHVAQIESIISGADQRMAGEVRLVLTEGLSSYWVMPRLARFQGAHPLVSLIATCDDSPGERIGEEADIAVSFIYPRQGDARVTKLGRLHFVPWASRRYLDMYGTPSSKESLKDHKLLDHSSYRHGGEDWAEWIALCRDQRSASLTANASSSLLAGIRAGAGIGLLPTYAIDVTSDIVPLDVGIHPSSDILLMYRPEVGGRLRVRAVIDWLKSIFSASETRWFQDGFVFPARSN